MPSLHAVLVTLTDATRENTVEMVIHDPTENIYATTDDYVHALEVRNAERILFVAGTMGLDPAGSAGATLTEQLDLVWSNLRTILASAGMTVDNIVRLTSYLRDAAYAGPNGEARRAALGGRAIPTTAIVVEMLEHDWLVEIEIIAVG